MPQPIALIASPNMSNPLRDIGAVVEAAGFRPYYLIFGAGSKSFLFVINQTRQPDGRLLPALIKKYAPGADPSAPVLSIGYSAGCWLARDGILVDPRDRAQTVGVVYNDGLHADEGQLATTRTYLDEGGKVLVIHSDVDPGGYPSTTETAQRLGAHPNLTVVHAPGDHSHTSLQGAKKIEAWLPTLGKGGGGGGIVDDEEFPPVPPTIPSAKAAFGGREVMLFGASALVAFTAVRMLR